jgi:outer membrane protein OmpA-like peptidoglycan-associated protein
MKQENIQLRGLGSSQPVASNNTATGRTENRRVSIVVSAD